MLFIYLFFYCVPGRPYTLSSQQPQFSRFPLAVALAACRKHSSRVGPWPLHPAVYTLTSGALVRRPLVSFLGLCRHSLSAAAVPEAFPVVLVRTRLLGLGFADCP